MPIDLKALALPGIRQLQPYQPGKPVEELERELGIEGAIKLASNENPLGMSELAKQAIVQALAEGSRYPDGSGFYLKRRLVELLSINEDQLVLGNGSNDVLELLARTFLEPCHNAVVSQHAFVMYNLIVTAQGADVRTVPALNWGHDLNAMAAAVDKNTRLMFIANPNNPTGTWVSLADIETLLETLPVTVIVVLDEAYFEYVDLPEYGSALTLLSRYPNLVVTRTFSKAYGLASLRAGYSVSHPDIAGLLNRLRQPFNVNSLALVAAEAILDDSEYLANSIAVNQQGYEQLTTGFEKLGLEYIASAGNFIAVEVPNTLEVYQALLQKGVIVRPIGIYEMPNHLRISIGRPDENQRCLDALARILLANESSA